MIIIRFLWKIGALLLWIVASAATLVMVITGAISAAFAIFSEVSKRLAREAVNGAVEMWRGI